MDSKDLLLDLEYNIEKISFLLGEWIDDYSFCEKPDPIAAIDYAQLSRKDRHGEQSMKWFWEYDRVHELVEIAMDYVRDTRELIEEAQENEK